MTTMATAAAFANDDALPLLVRAIHFAAKKHRMQRRKDPDATPYINHPIDVLHVLVHEAGVSGIDVLCAGVLHDTIEDTQTSAAELTEHFGERISAIVQEVTDDKSLPKAERKRRQIIHAADLSVGAKLVKLADKICNLRDMSSCPPTNWSLARRVDYFDWAKAVVDALRGECRELELIFDAVYLLRPEPVDEDRLVGPPCR